LRIDVGGVIGEHVCSVDEFERCRYLGSEGGVYARAGKGMSSLGGVASLHGGPLLGLLGEFKTHLNLLGGESSGK
jgi:hypothetical protein